MRDNDESGQMIDGRTRLLILWYNIKKITLFQGLDRYLFENS